MSAGGIPFAPRSYSVSAWTLIQPNELIPPIENMISTEAQGGGWALYAGVSQTGNSWNYVFRFASPTGPQGYWNVVAPVMTGSWVHLAAVVDGDASTLTLYVNGAVASRVTTSSAILPGSPTLYLARSAELSPLFSLTGALDDIAIYSRALADAEVAQLGQGPALPPSP
jgi:hypothetical protein